MESEKKTPAPATHTPVEGSAAPGKKRYRKPELSEFGNVRALTRAGGTMASEPRTGGKHN